MSVFGKIAGLVLFVWSSLSFASGNPALPEAFGFFVKNSSGYEKIWPMSEAVIADQEKILAVLNRLPILAVHQGKTELLAHLQDQQDISRLRIRSKGMKLLSPPVDVGFDVIPMQRRGYFRIVLTGVAKPGAYLLLGHAMAGQNGVGAAAMSDPQEQFADMFSPRANPGADSSRMAGFVEEALRSYPGHAMLQAFHADWKAVGDSLRDDQAYRHVSEAQQRNGGCRSDKCRRTTLGRIKVEIDAYLQRFPSGKHAEKARQEKARVVGQLEQLGSSSPDASEWLQR